MRRDVILLSVGFFLGGECDTTIITSELRRSEGEGAHQYSANIILDPLASLSRSCTDVITGLL